MEFLLDHKRESEKLMSGKVRSIEKARLRQQQRDGEITVSLLRLINSNASLGVLIGREMPIRQSHLLGKLARAVSLEIDQYNATHKTLCEKYANKDSDGKAVLFNAEGQPVAEADQPGVYKYDIPKEKLEDFNRESTELNETEVSIPGVKIKVGELEGVKIAPAHMMNLDWLIEE